MSKQIDGKGPTYKVVLAAEGFFWKKAFATYSSMMQSEEKWTGVPSKFKTHELAVHAFRCLSGCLCIKYGSQVAVFDTYPCKPYLMLSTCSPGIVERTADSIICGVRHHPCVMDGYFFLHASMYPSRELLLSADSLARIETIASEVEFD